MATELFKINYNSAVTVLMECVGNIQPTDGGQFVDDLWSDSSADMFYVY